jgi:succinate dehydrogenase hydrophobic anchor subunit
MDVFKAIVGVFFVVAGLVVVIFHKDAKAFYDDWFGALYQYFPLLPRGRIITICAILFGALSIIGGSLVFLLSLPIA